MVLSFDVKFLRYSFHPDQTIFLKKKNAFFLETGNLKKHF